jgi:uncharacterized protein YdeI (YjbR/CyaY-like superfamily)
MNKPNPQVDGFLKKAKKWQKEMEKLRAILLEFPLTEELKWGKPCYAFQQSNLVIIVPFKDTCALLFCKGALLKDPKKILIQPTENSQAARQVRFTSAGEIAKLAPTLEAYVREAIEAEKSGLRITYKKISEFKVPEEFQQKLEASPVLKTAFAALTPGRQRAYLLYFSGAKQSQTRESRVEKCAPRILKGKGLDDE